MAINFPDSPSNGDTFTANGKTFVYNSTNTSWRPQTAAESGGTDVLADMAALIAKTGMSNGDQALVQSNNNLYMYSGSGWYKIATIQNDAPSAITGVDGSYVLATDGTATTITAVSTDPEGFALTWSYTASGLGSIATVSQADNVFTVTPSTDAANDGSFTLTISATDGINGAVSTAPSFTLSFSITNSRYTSLSVKATNTGSNQTFDDASTSNHTIAVAGDTTASTFSPYRHGGYSAYFDGSGDYLTFPHSTSTAEWWNDDFTIEAWVYYTSFTENSQGRPHVLKHGVVGSTTDYWSFGAISNGTLLFYYWNGSAIATCVSTSTLTLNTWHHITMCHDDSDNEINLYLDGVNVKTHTVSGTPQSSSSSTMIIGNNDSSYFTGYMQDLRVIKGTEVYTTNFTPPTEPLTAVTNTKFLLGDLPYFKDQSTSNHAITVNGDASLKPKSLFDNAPYSEASHGASAYFDGTGDYLTISASADFNFGTGDATLECWIYPASSVGILFATGNASSSDQFGIFGSYGEGLWWGETASNSSRPSGNQWAHVAVSREGNTIRRYINGVQASTGTNTGSIGSSSATAYVGRRPSGGYPFEGYIADLRVVKGTAVYTSNFTPPTAPLTAITNTKFLLNPETSISDLSQSSEITCFGDAATSTTQVKFAGTKSIYLDGTGDYLTGPSPATIGIGTGDFTIECWFYATDAGLDRGIWETRTDGYPNHSDGLALTRITETTFRVFGTSQLIVSSATTITNNWHHLAVVRNSGTLEFFVNGVSQGTASNSTNMNSSQPIAIGSGRYTTSNSTPTHAVKGYIQDFRVLTSALYTSNFTPPTTELEG
mgnify:CR=1 FL=1